MAGEAHDRTFLGLADAVRRRRRELALTQADLADLAGCSVRFVQFVEDGKPSVRLDKLVDLLAVLGLGLDVRRGAHGVTEAGA